MTYYNIPACSSRIREIEAEIQDAENSIKAIQNECEELVPQGKLTALDALRKLEARESEEVAKQKRIQRLDAIRQSITDLGIELESVQDRYAELKEKRNELGREIVAAGDKAVEAQKAYYSALRDFERVAKTSGNEFKQIEDNHRLDIADISPYEGLILKCHSRYIDYPRYDLQSHRVHSLEYFLKEVSGIVD